MLIAKGSLVVALEKNEQSIPLENVLRSLPGDDQPMVLVVGNENSGVSQETLSVCDRVGSLPMRGKKASLNVSVAFGVAAYLITGHT